MKITRNVITDLLPVYLSGGASSDTTALIEEFLGQDPGLASVVEEQKRELSSQRELLQPVVAPSPDHQLRTLARTRLLMKRQKWSLALALTLTTLPLSFVFSGGHLTFMMVRDEPVMAVASWVGAAFLWIQYFVTHRRLRMAGL